MKAVGGPSGFGQPKADVPTILLTAPSRRVKALWRVASTPRITNPLMAQTSWNINWDVPNTPAPRRNPLSSATNRTSALPHPRHPSLKPGSPHGATLQPTHFYSTPIQFGSVGTPETPFNYSPPRKRKRVEVDENTPASLASEISGPSAKHQKRASPRTTSQKIEAVLHAIKEQNWTFPSFLYHIFQTKDGKGLEIGKDIKQDFTGQIKAFGGVKMKGKSCVT
ncbi:hypothetical protein B0H10DRAFT_1961203 [Mycena sp. CBHHK59/15]|nr:hypothetical protein B0H10DRAFT_1974711 [Mycena sp. CBHHK59/15]KAJ6587242.1 hypothetical protein B0H10DRAFT_2442646 [Mycena sp. CBHHK59/15]KAJ6590209.1 hypothetical protein B0H10DRAFT_1961203 [Mycena sp. CBHHK59/15]